MDTLTHALSGALIARASAPVRPRPGDLPSGLRTAAGFAAAAFPDADFALRLVDTLTYLNWHQGPTHSLVLLPVWAWLLARLFAALDSARHGWRAYFAPAVLGLAAHVAGDVITAYGPMLLWPLTDARFAFPLVFVFDAWISAIVALGLVSALIVARPRRVGVAALLALAAYGGVLEAARQQALNVGALYAAHHLPHAVHVHALPQPLSPLNRMIVVETVWGYHVARVSLRPGARRAPPVPASGLLARMSAAYVPLADARWQSIGRFGDGHGDGQAEAYGAGEARGKSPWEGPAGADAALAHEAWSDPAFAPFRRFAELPALHRIERGAGGVCVWFHDLRFSFPELPPSFRFGLCRDDASQPWRLARERGAFWID